MCSKETKYMNSAMYLLYVYDKIDAISPNSFAVILPSNYNKKCFFSNLLTACVHTEPNTFVWFVLFVLYVDYIEEKKPLHRAYADSYTVITK